MILNKIEDPRDNLQKATRYQVWQFAKANGIEFPESAPADIVRAALRQRGITRINVRTPVLGSVSAPQGSAIVPTAGNGTQRDAIADLEMQWRRDQERERQEQARDQGSSLSAMGINELRKECQRLEIKLSRRDNMVSMREKIEAARNGQNAA